MPINRDLGRIRDRRFKTEISSAKIEEIAVSVQPSLNVTNVRPDGRLWDNHYRIRVGKYRVGIALEDNVVVLISFRPRQDFYRYFP